MHDVFDYSYQCEPVFFKRVDKIAKSLNKLKKEYALSDLEEVLYSNKEIIRYNYDYIKSGNFEKIHKDRVIEILSI